MGFHVDISKSFPDFSLDVSFEVPSGLTVLFGPSGSGKSLTLRALAGLLRPDRGCIEVGSRLLFDAEHGVNLPPQARCLGVVMQQHALFPHMTIAENILYGARGIPAARRAGALSFHLHAMRLEGLEGKYPREISGGQEQRAAFARALIGEPSALLLDEPFSALDLPTRVAMRECLSRALKRSGIPVLLVTHDLEEACSIADRLVVIMNGRVAQIGEVEQVLRQPASREVAALFHRAHCRLP
jgi:molybdate transport system ATP-binding protein